MVKVVLVGEIGSGKTYISKQFGYPVFNADEVVSQIYKTDRNCFNLIKKKIPNFFSSFPIKKEELVKSILKDKINLKKISNIVHPIVRRKMNKFIKKNKSKKIIVLDVPLFLENKLNKKNDVIIFIDSKKNELKKRLKKRKNYNYLLIKRFRELQMPIKIKKKKSDFIIKNNYLKNSIKQNVKKIIEQLV
ncbi:MAG: dephospho-CoA kinase [Pelagibacteraceae bacterium]|nr:dephospho-CoA kinase [Pelagibacteraceae bacterium]PHX89235.1 MAG: dephospho-CoA kinase [Pelagibacteraceae bacterium]